MKNNINKKIGATLLTAAVMAGVAIIPMSNAAIEEAVEKTPSISYKVHVQDKDWMNWEKDGNRAGTTGESLRMEAIKISMENCEGVTLHVKAHIQDHGDREYTITPADVDTIIGTQWEARRIESITITTEGLHEKGYKLQYQAHVQEIGDQGWKNEGEEAGTHYEQKRLESIQLRIVEDMEAIKTNAVNTLTRYDDVLSTIADTDALTLANYENLSKIIKNTKEEISKAETATEVREKVNSVETEIKKVYQKLEELLAKVAIETAKEQAKAKEDIEGYKKAVEEVKDLSESDKTIIETIIANATETVENANIPEDVEEAIDNLATLMEQYNTVALTKVRNDAIEQLSEYLEGANTGVRETISKAIKEINTATTTTAVTDKLTETLNIVDPLLSAQKEAYEKLKVYEEALKDTTKISTANKTVIRNEISKVKEQIDNATLATDVTNTIIPAFENYLAQYYEVLVTEADAKLLQEAIDSAVETLKQYTSYADAGNVVKTKANRAITNLRKLFNVETLDADVQDEANTPKITTVAEVKDLLGEKPTEQSAGSGYLKILEDEIKKIEEDIASAEAAYTEEYNKAKAILDKYSESIANIGLTDKELNDIRTMINNTQTNIEKATKGPEVKKAITLFENYMSTYYPEVATMVEDYKIESTREDAIKELEEYKTSKVEDVANIAKTAIDNIKKATTLENINTLLTQAKSSITEKINNNKLKAAKETAVAKFTNYLTYESDNDEIAKNVRKIAAKAVEAIEACTTVEDVKEGNVVTKGVNTIAKEEMDRINELLGIEEKTEQEQLEEARKIALEKVNGYMELAEELEATKLSEELQAYNAVINEAENEAEMDEAIANMEAYIAKNYPVLDTQVKEIRKLEVCFADDYEYANEADVSKIREVAEKAIADLKDTTKKEEKETEATYVARIAEQAKTDIDEIVAKIEALNEYKETAKETIENEQGGTSSIKNTYKNKIDALRIDNCEFADNGDKTFTCTEKVAENGKTIVEQAQEAIAAYNASIVDNTRQANA